MSHELGWSRAERRKQVRAAVAYFETMGLVSGDIVPEKDNKTKRERERNELVTGVLKELEPKDWVERVEREASKIAMYPRGVLTPSGLGFGQLARGGAASLGAGASGGHGEKTTFSRARFGAGEVVALRNAFAKRVSANGGISGDDQPPCVGISELVGAMHEVPGYEGVKEKDLKYVLEENGMVGRSVVDCDEFLEVSIRF